MSDFRKKFGIVILMDALGAREYSDEKIRKFLKSRSLIKKVLVEQAKEVQESTENIIDLPMVTYTFGDTLVIVIQINRRVEKKRLGQIFGAIMLVQNFLVASLKSEVLLRGAFSIGEYIDDEESNTVMGAAVTDAASWYEKADWFGVASTPATTYFLEHLFEKYKSRFTTIDSFNSNYLLRYPLPLKGGQEIESYCVSWPGRLLHSDGDRAELTYLDIISKMKIPLGTEKKYLNSHRFFKHAVKCYKETEW